MIDHAIQIESDLERARQARAQSDRDEMQRTCPRCPAPLRGDRCQSCGFCVGCEGGDACPA